MKSLESWIWDAACSIRRANDTAKDKDYILPLMFTKRLCDAYNAEIYRPLAEIVETATRDSAFLKPEAKLQSVPGGQDKLKVIEAEARETDQALGRILKQLGV